jgi:hypothetical protein
LAPLDVRIDVALFELSSFSKCQQTSIKATDLILVIKCQQISDFHPHVRNIFSFLLRSLEIFYLDAPAVVTTTDVPIGLDDDTKGQARLSIADRRAEACSVSPRRDDSNVDVI